MTNDDLIVLMLDALYDADNPKAILHELKEPEQLLVQTFLLSFSSGRQKPSDCATDGRWPQDWEL